MARSSYIYVITPAFSWEALHCFTVKHEAISYWKSTLNRDDQYRLLRFPDRGSFRGFGETTTPDWAEIAWPV